jgi:hypothetical protein
MPLSAQQLQTLKTSIAANTAAIQAGQANAGIFIGSQIKDIPNNDDGNLCIATWYNLVAAPNFWAWQSSVSRTSIYHTTSDIGRVFDWQTFKAQSVTEQNAWIQMFMGDAAPFHRISLRDGVLSIFSGSAAQNNQRAHIFATARRLAKNIEKLFAIAPVAEGGVSPITNNGNTLTDALGATTNPAVMVFEGSCSAQDINTARNLP